MPAKDESTRTAILEAARTLFRKHGYDPVRLEDVAKLARKQRTTVYIYFKNKEDLFYDIIRQDVDAIYLELAQAVSRSNQASVQFRDFCEARFLIMKERANDFLILSSEVLKTPYIVDVMREQYEDRQFSFIKRILRHGQDSGEFAPVAEEQLDDLVWIFITAMRGITISYFTGLLNVTMADIVESLCAMILEHPLLKVS